VLDTGKDEGNPQKLGTDGYFSATAFNNNIRMGQNLLPDRNFPLGWILVLYHGAPRAKPVVPL
jgi:hypothetical protein